MSEQERFDWDDDLDFESLADEQVMQEGSMEELEDFGEETQVSPPEIDVNVASGKDSAKGKSGSLGLGLSATGLGTLFAVSTLVSGLGLAGAMLFVGNIDPAVLWNPEGLTQVNQWFNFQNYPMNLLYILVTGVVSLGLLGSWAVARSIKSAQTRHKATAGLLEQVTALRLDKEEAWQNSNLKTDPQVAAFVAETLGSWRLQMARQAKSTGLEGELDRLHKALQSKSREDMVGRFDNPYAGELADAAVQLFDEAEAARHEARESRDNDEHQSEEIISIIQDARSWNRLTREKMGTQGVAADKLSSHLVQLGTLVSQMAGSQDQSQISAAVADITREVSSWGTGSAAVDGQKTMAELVDRGSKLAFQIAMEVARLGTRGERLLPMTQALEELTNQFRQATQSMNDGSVSEAQARVKERLEQVHSRLEKGTGQDAAKLTDITGQLISSASQVSQDLVEVSGTFNQQGERLTKLGESVSSLTGVVFNSAGISVGNPDNPPEGGLNLTQHDPFASGVTQNSSVADVDPFSQSDNLLLSSNAQLEDSGFLTSVTPGAENDYASAKAELPSDEEKVYDLAEFGAVRVDDPENTKAQEDEIHDLSEFGAVTLA